MKTSFLDYYMTILDKVSFDTKLFHKEYKKALNTLRPEDSRQLTNWLKDKGLYANLTEIQTTGVSGQRE